MAIATTLLPSPWLRPLNHLDAIDDRQTVAHPPCALGRIKARVQRVNAETDDVKTFAVPVLRHRLVLHPDAELEGVGSDAVVESILREAPVPKAIG